MMLENSQFLIKPGAYEHYKGGTYVVENIITHRKGPGGEWVKLTDPEVVYRNLETQFEPVNGIKQHVIKTYARTLSSFMGYAEVEEPLGQKKLVKRFTAI